MKSERERRVTRGRRGTKQKQKLLFLKKPENYRKFFTKNYVTEHIRIANSSTVQ
jgi:hypothetical protein